jgi:lysophospholipase L1-like esterase
MDPSPPQPPARRKRLLGRRLLLLLVTLAVMLGLVELGFRLTWDPPALAELQIAGMYRNAEPPGTVALEPGYRNTLQLSGREERTDVAINALGMRGPEIGVKQPGERRVLCLGDSMVFGYGVPFEDTFGARLQALLARRPGDRVTVGNGGVPGYGVVDAGHQLARMLGPFDPDAVVLCVYLGNDFVDDQRSEHTVEAGLMFEGAWARLFRTSPRAKLALRSRAWMYVETSLIGRGSPLALRPVAIAEDMAALDGFPKHDGPPNQVHAGLFLDAVDENKRWAPPQPGPPVLPRVFERLRQTLAGIKTTAGARPVQVLILPTLWQLDDGMRVAMLEQLGLNPAEYRAGLAQERVARACAAAGLPVQDVTALFAKEPKPAALFLSDHGHFSSAGHAVVAAWLADAIPALLR